MPSPVFADTYNIFFSIRLFNRSDLFITTTESLNFFSIICLGSKTSKQRSDDLYDSSVKAIPIFSILDTLPDLTPAVSSSVISTPFKNRFFLTTSLVVPGTSLTRATFFSTNKLNKEDFPTLGRPTSTTFFFIISD